MCARKSARSPRPTRSSSRRDCRKPGPARSCGAFCARLPKTTSPISATPPRWRNPPWSTTSSAIVRTDGRRPLAEPVEGFGAQPGALVVGSLDRGFSANARNNFHGEAGRLQRPGVAELSGGGVLCGGVTGPMLQTAPRVRAVQLLDAGRRAEADGHVEVAYQFYRQTADRYAHSAEAAAAREALARLSAG